MRAAIVLTLTLALAAGSAMAALGAAPSDFGGVPVRQARSLAAAGASSASSATTYSVTESTLDSGTVVREYSDGGGQVFAVSWSGPTLPDLRTLLGDKFAVMTTAAARRTKAGHSQLALSQSDVVIVSTGHMRAFSGRAWIPAALPAGFDTTILN